MGIGASCAAGEVSSATDIAATADRRTVRRRMSDVLSDECLDRIRVSAGLRVIPTATTVQPTTAERFAGEVERHNSASSNRLVMQPLGDQISRPTGARDNPVGSVTSVTRERDCDRHRLGEGALPPATLVRYGDTNLASARPKKTNGVVAIVVLIPPPSPFACCDIEHVPAAP
jgi:hypothetical protein